MIKRSRLKKKQKKCPKNGIAHASVSYNNSIVTVADRQGNALLWSSAGRAGFRNTRKHTTFAAQAAAILAASEALERGIKRLILKILGPGPGRESIIRGIIQEGPRLLRIMDTTEAPHNGCRAPKRRRV